MSCDIFCRGKRAWFAAYTTMVSGLTTASLKRTPKSILSIELYTLYLGQVRFCNSIYTHITRNALACNTYTFKWLRIVRHFRSFGYAKKTGKLLWTMSVRYTRQCCYNWKSTTLIGRLARLELEVVMSTYVTLYNWWSKYDDKWCPTHRFEAYIQATRPIKTDEALIECLNSLTSVSTKMAIKTKAANKIHWLKREVPKKKTTQRKIDLHDDVSPKNTIKKAQQKHTLCKIYNIQKARDYNAQQ